MAEVVVPEAKHATRVPLGPVRAPTDEHAARSTLRRQVAHLEAALSHALVRSFEMRGDGRAAKPAPGRGGAPARLLDLGELERVRDELAARLRAVERDNAELAERQAGARRRLEQMRLEPGRHRFTRIALSELGEPGCGVWQVRPRLGLIGMLAGWWQVTLSSGCPLPAGG